MPAIEKNWKIGFPVTLFIGYIDNIKHLNNSI